MVSRPKKNSHLKIGFELCLHLIVGSVVYLVIAALAIGIGAILEWAQTTITIDPVVSATLIAAKYLILFADISLFVVFVISSIRSFGVQLWKH